MFPSFYSPTLNPEVMCKSHGGETRSFLWEDIDMPHLERLHLPQEEAAASWAGLTSQHQVWNWRPQNYHSVDATKETYLL